MYFMLYFFETYSQCSISMSLPSNLYMQSCIHLYQIQNNSKSNSATAPVNPRLYLRTIDFKRSKNRNKYITHQQIQKKMVNPSFVMSAYTIKDEQVRRQVNYRNTAIKYFVVVLACFVVFGCEYCFDNPSALESSIEENQHHVRQEPLSPFQFNLLYSLYAFPNIIVPLFGGILIDTKGPRIALIITCIVCVFGQIIFGIGGFKNMWMIMLIGRFVFGLGGQVLHAAQNTIISRWFKASQLSMVLGICISFPKMGSSLNSIISPSVSQHFQDNQQWQGLYPNVGMPLLIGLGFMTISFFLGLVLAYIDRKTQKEQRSIHQSQVLSKSKAMPKRISQKPKAQAIPKKKSIISKIPESQIQFQPQKTYKKKSMISRIPESAIQAQASQYQNKNHITKIPPLQKQKSDYDDIQQVYSPGGRRSVTFTQRSNVSMNDNDIERNAEGGHLNFSGIKKLPITYWLLLIISMLAQALFIPFLDNGNSYFLAIYKQIQKPDEAGIYLILPYVVSSVLVVPLGFFADKVRNRGYLLIGSTIFIFLTYSFMMYVQTDADLRNSTYIPWIPVALLGVCICIFCTIIVPTVPMICPIQLLGTGFGMMQMLQNFALAVFPLLSGIIRSTQQSDQNPALGQLKGFHLQTSFFFIVSCVCVSMAIFLQAADRFRGNKLKVKDFRKTYITKVMREE